MTVCSKFDFVFTLDYNSKFCVLKIASIIIIFISNSVTQGKTVKDYYHNGAMSPFCDRKDFSGCNGIISTSRSSYWQ